MMPLTGTWARLKATRVVELEEDGVSSPVAIRIATGEACARQRMARIIGFSAAKAADLVWWEDGPKFRLGLSGDLERLTADQIDRLERELGVKRYRVH